EDRGCGRVCDLDVVEWNTSNMACRRGGTSLQPESLHGAVTLPVVINGVPHTAVVKEFSTGSLGWNINGKTEVSKSGRISDALGNPLAATQLLDEPYGTVLLCVRRQVGWRDVHLCGRASVFWSCNAHKLVVPELSFS